MNSYLYAIKTAVFTFPLIAFLVTIPYILYNYHKYGSISLIRTIIIYSFILYLINIFFLVILPLPSISYVKTLTTPRYQIVPFTFIKDITAVVKVTDFSSFISIFNKQVVLQVIYNIFMTIPFGIYMRYYFKAGMFKTILITFILSLFFELTQLTGLYWIYPRGYRLFDVDDLFLNTLGGFIGYLLTPIICFILPSRDTIDDVSYSRGEKVGLFRRGIAFIIDNLLVLLVCSFIGYHIMPYIIIVVLYYIVFSILMRGQTLGKKIVSIKVLSIDGICKWYQYALRYGTLYFVFLPLPYYISLLFESFNKTSFNYQVVIVIEIIFLIILYFIFLYRLIISLFNTNRLSLHELVSKTMIISSINYKKKDDVYTSIEINENGLDEYNENILKD